MSKLLKDTLEEVTERASLKDIGVEFVIGSDTKQLMVHFTISRKGKAFRFYNSQDPAFQGRINLGNVYMIDGDTGKVVVGGQSVARVMPDVKTQQGVDLPGWQGMLNPKLAECTIFTAWLHAPFVFTVPGRNYLEDFLCGAAEEGPRLVVVRNYRAI